jgi:ribosomal protein S18 acetylase RimI-like enzyme
MSYQIVSTLTKPQISELTELYRQEFWSRDRTESEVEKMLANSDIVIGIVDDHDHLVGFTRVMTDFVYRAVIFDVIVKATHRQQGLGRRLLDAIIEHPQLQNVEYLGLFCLPEMMSFYEQWGFGDAGELRLMLRLHKPLSKKAPAQ